MGVSVQARRLLAPLALGMTLVMAGSASPLPRSDANDAAAELSSVPAAQAPASVTDVFPRSSTTAPSAAGALPPAVRVAAARAPGRELAEARVPAVLLAAYRAAAGSVPSSCHLPVSLLAAIGQVESGSLVGDQLDAQHRTSILGPVLDGRGFAAIPDTDDGKLDGDASWDRAMGPMQFVPSTWRSFGVDGDGDGVADPQDVEDAASSAAAYLCYGGRDLAQPATLRSAILSYNHSAAYELLVMTYQQRYAQLGIDKGLTVMGIPSYVTAVGMTPVSGLDLSSTVQARRPATSNRPARDAGTASSSSPVHSSPVIQQATTRPGTPRPGAVHDSLPVQAGPAAAGSSTPAHPSVKPTAKPTAKPAGQPTAQPTQATTPDPSSPASAPSDTPSAPAGTPTGTPAGDPTGTPSGTPTGTPGEDPSTCVSVDPDAAADQTGPAPATTDPTVSICPPCDANGDPVTLPAAGPEDGPEDGPAGGPEDGAGGAAPVCSPQAATEPSSSSAP